MTVRWWCKADACWKRFRRHQWRTRRREMLRIEYEWWMSPVIDHEPVIRASEEEIVRW